MLKRSLEGAVNSACFQDHKMAFISGPRQCGKTTMAKMMLKKRKEGAYHNWDDVVFRRAWAKSPRSVLESGGCGIPLIAFDEIHKARGWKRSLKGLYDTLESPADILVTGSARLNVYKKGGDSLVGRYNHFRLHPFTLREIERDDVPPPADLIDMLFRRDVAPRRDRQERLEALLRFGGFPEPFLAQDEKRARLWRRQRVEMVIREDLRDLTRIPELGRIEMLASLLPERVGSLFSTASLRDVLEVSFETVKRWLGCLKDLYYAFEIKPYQRSVARSIRKAGKVYLWDSSEVMDPGPRFENLVACHLLKTCHYWTDTGEGTFELSFLRNKEGGEFDFLILRDRKPWLPVEAKLDDPTPAPAWRKFAKDVPCSRWVQIVATPGVWRLHEEEDRQLLVASASEGLIYFA